MYAWMHATATMQRTVRRVPYEYQAVSACSISSESASSESACVGMARKRDGGPNECIGNYIYGDITQLQ